MALLTMTVASRVVIRQVATALRERADRLNAKVLDGKPDAAPDVAAEVYDLAADAFVALGEPATEGACRAAARDLRDVAIRGWVTP